MREHCRGTLDAFKVPAFVTVTDRDLSAERMKKARVRTNHG